jgi:hypothetical protein
MYIASDTPPEHTTASLSSCGSVILPLIAAIIPFGRTRGILDDMTDESSSANSDEDEDVRAAIAGELRLLEPSVRRTPTAVEAMLHQATVIPP